ncbi:hypothetical protein K2Z84_18760 [Candidatus Binatia bacterium]|nr:hypothetical protein [Candidatus Binatia bacterium]
MSTPPSSHGARERRERILAHIGRYRVTLRAALTALLGQDPGNDLDALVASGLVVREPVSGRLSLYRLTLAGALAAGVPKDRAERPGSRALSVHLALLWFCEMGAERRLRLETEELRALLGEGAPAVDQAPHVAEEQAAGEPRLYRVFLLGQRASEAYTLAAIERDIGAALETGDARGFWLKRRVYGYLVLTELESRLRRLERAIHKRGLDSKALVRVQCAPGPKTLRTALDAYRRTHPAPLRGTAREATPRRERR